MRRRLFWLAVLALCLGPGVAGQGAEEASVPRISVGDLKKASDAGQVLILDVRDATWYAEGHLPGAISVPLEELPQKLVALKAEKRPIVAYCA
jgi:rhodanese-related sulfurtransferase